MCGPVLHVGVEALPQKFEAILCCGVISTLVVLEVLSGDRRAVFRLYLGSFGCHFLMLSGKKQLVI